MVSILRRIPGYRSATWWKAIIASVFYLFALLVVMALFIPSAPTLAADDVKPTSSGSVVIKGSTFANKPVYLSANDQEVQQSTADSQGKFSFAINNLADGTYSYTVAACRSKNKKYCTSKNLVVMVDTIPPAKPIITLPQALPDDSEQAVVLAGTAEPKSHVLVKNDNGDVLGESDSAENGEFSIDTHLAIGGNTISVKAVDSAGNESEPTVSTLTFAPTKYTATIERVIDGDTIKLSTGEVVRYIGIDTPETVHPSLPVQCYGKEASAKNKELVEGKQVKLEKDVSETDKYGRLLRYVWIGEMMVNEHLVAEGYAHASSYPPDVKYQGRFIAAQQIARELKKGLWGEACVTPTSTASPLRSVQGATTVVQPTKTNSYVAPTATNQPAQPTQQITQQNSGGYACDCSKTCPNMSSCAEAQYQLNVCGCGVRDADKDGIACDVDCQ